jgi:hypothetical protein
MGLTGLLTASEGMLEAPDLVAVQTYSSIVK